MSIAASLIAEFDHESASTRKILACVPEEQFGYKPHEKSMSLVRLASHIAEMGTWAVVTMTTTDYAPPADFKPFVAASKAELLEKFDEHTAAARKVLADASDEDYLAQWTMTWSGYKVFDAPRITAIRSFIMNHTIHHRGQLTVYLRLLDIPFPGVYGPSATDKS